ncbi:DUF1801 domain-containing protein [Rhodobacter sp. SY28-1]|uniref:DUF1801 domain-containing protein n=1 Tax=Rhodobacter sp. SY28-1 TaxID=2562317 RepID=UPI0010BFC528|nr:DUF1801 domain-containing protein [Rhodobacter sp. SY28-1]
MKPETIDAYHALQNPDDRAICDRLRAEIKAGLPEAEGKIWHRHPVWFLAGNPTVGYSKQKRGIRLMFWSGMGFDEPGLLPGTGKFKDASVFYISADQIDPTDLQRWLDKARHVQWDYQNLMRKGRLERLV